MVLGEALRSLAGVALFAASGTGLTELLPAVRRLPLARRLAHAYLLGVAWTAGSLYALSYWLAVSIRPPAVVTVALVPALAGALCWRYRSRFPRQADTPAPARVGPSGRRAQRLALVCGGLVTVALLCDALTNPLTDWDGRMTWSTQARYVRAEGTVEPRVLTTPGFYVNCPGYPLLMPVAQAAVLEVSQASIDHHAFRPLYAAFFPVWLLVLYGGAQRSAGREAAAWTTLAAAMLSVPAFANAGGAASAYSDLPLACFVGAGALLLLGPQGKPSTGLAAGILLGAGALTKAEGEILTPLAILVAAVLPLSIPGAARRREIWRRRRTMLVLAALPVALALLLLHSWRAGIPARFESFTRLTSWSLLWPGIFTRLPTLAHDAGAAMLSFVYWGAFWWVTPLVVLAGWRALRRRPARALLLLAGAPLGVGWLYATIAVDSHFIVLTTLDRFLIQASVPMFVVFAMALRDLVRRTEWPWRWAWLYRRRAE